MENITGTFYELISQRKVKHFGRLWTPYSLAISVLFLKSQMFCNSVVNIQNKNLNMADEYCCVSPALCQSPYSCQGENTQS